MQPTGWSGQPPGAATPAPGWSEPAPGWGEPVPGPTGPAPGWGDHAPGFANPAPTWGAADQAPPETVEPRGVGWTIAAHVVLWGGLLFVAATTSPLLRPLIEAGAPFRVVNALGTFYSLLPVVVAFVLAGRSALLRGLGAGIGLVLVVVALLWSLVPDDAQVAWAVRIVGYVFVLGGWMIVRRHARTAFALLGVLVLVLLLWFPPWDFALDLRNLPVRQGSASPFVISLWFDLPAVATGVIGGIASLLRPRPTRSGDLVGVAVVGGLLALLAAAVGLSYVLSILR